MKSRHVLAISKYLAIGAAICAVGRWFPDFLIYRLQDYPLIQNAAATVVIAFGALSLLVMAILIVFVAYLVAMAFLDLFR